MSKLVAQTENQLRAALEAAAAAAVAAGELPEGTLAPYVVEIPADRKNGDLATNAAMVSARAFRKAPKMIADTLLRHLDLSDTVLERAEVAGPGFMNFFLAPGFYGGVVEEILDRGAEYGRSDHGKGEKVMVEFVSANPTGPMHMGNARGGALGDCLAAVMEAAGYEVWREFYVNDAGNQIEKFALSLDVRYIQHCKGEDAIALPEDAYHGDDIKEHAKNFAALHGDKYVDTDEKTRREALVAYALPLNIEKMHADMAKYRIVYDRWFHESDLHNGGDVKEVIDLLAAKGLTYEKDGALWYKNAEVQRARLLKEGKSEADIEKLELKDDVLVRANGNPTYFAADIAYHRNKFLRGFDTCIDVWGADHHGHVARMKGAMDALGLSGDKLEVVLMQLVRLMKNGEMVRMSKRTGKAIQLADLLDEVPVDAARFFFNLREANTQMDFDLGLAVEQDSANPVYYVQYAHARICSIFKKLAADGVEWKREAADFALLTSSEERELIRLLGAYTGEITAASDERDPARITRYCQDVAAQYHKFYNGCRVMGVEEPLMQARLCLCAATRTVLCNALTLLKIDAPESM